MVLGLGLWPKCPGKKRGHSGLAVHMKRETERPSSVLLTLISTNFPEANRSKGGGRGLWPLEMGGTKFYRFKTPCFGGFAGSDSRNECIVGSFLCEKGLIEGIGEPTE